MIRRCKKTVSEISKVSAVLTFARIVFAVRCITAVGVPALALMTFSVGRWQTEEFSRLPEKRVEIDGRDIRAIDSSIATI